MSILSIQISMDLLWTIMDQLAIPDGCICRDNQGYYTLYEMKFNAFLDILKTLTEKILYPFHCKTNAYWGWTLPNLRPNHI